MRFCQSYLEFGNPVIDYFMRNQIFEEMMLVYGRMSFASRQAMVQVFVTVVEMGSEDQIAELFDMKVLNLFLEVLEFGDNELSAELQLKAIERMWLVCPEGKKNEFLSVFREGGGFRTLLGLEVCTDQANCLNELLDPAYV
jgi:hypothetical protein